MRNIIKEKQKLDSIDIKRQNPILRNIAKSEKYLIEDFNRNLEQIFREKLAPIIKVIAEKTPNKDKIKTREVKIDGEEEIYVIPENIFQYFHKSYIENSELREYFEKQLKMWFCDKTEIIRNKTKSLETYDDLMRRREDAFALASLAISAFHKKPHMILRNAQKRTGLVLSEGNVAELASGEGKTLSAVLPAYLMSLTKKGVHIMTSNSYLSKRDFDELLPIYEALGVSAGYNPSNEIEFAEILGINLDTVTPEEALLIPKLYIKYKQEAYAKDITFGAMSSFAFDNLRDNTIKNINNMIQRVLPPGFAIIDEIDEALIDSAGLPYILSMPSPVYMEDMSLDDLCKTLGLSREKLPKTIETQIEDLDHLSYEEAKYIANTYAHTELLPDPREYQEIAQEVYDKAKIGLVRDNMNPGQKKYNTAKEYFRALRDADIEIIIKDKYDIFYCREENDFIVSDNYYEKYLKECYKRIQINALARENKEKITQDKNYVENEDYFFVGKKIKLTLKGAEKILLDENYKEFREDYEKHITLANKSSVEALHHFNQAITANLKMENGRDYIVKDGEIKVLRNGIVQEKSSYSDGLHQAIEIKEKIEPSKRTIESRTATSITQRNLIMQYLMSPGMTGTASAKIFGKVYGKNTVRIPRACVEEKDINELTGVEEKETKITLNVEDKINLIIRSVEQSKAEVIQQPVLIVVSNPNEFSLLREALEKRFGRDVNVLTPDEPDDIAAMKIIEAGRPGAVTLTTEMAGRGTDIILGGDKETYVELEVIKRKRKIEAEDGKIPKKDEQAIMGVIRRKIIEDINNKGLFTKDSEEINKQALEIVGLKVISCGMFDLKRTDDQLKGRTGRNGSSGVFERYICLEDLRRLGKSSLDLDHPIEDYLKKYKQENGNVVITKEKYEELINGIKQKAKDNGIDALEVQRIINDYIEIFKRNSNGNIVVSVDEYNEKIARFIDELKNIGITTIDSNETLDVFLKGAVRKPTGELEIEQKLYNKIIKGIEHKQELNEQEIMLHILNSQKLNNQAAEFTQKLREFRRRILSGDIDPEIIVKNMILNVADAIISSYVQVNENSKEYLTEPFNSGNVKINFETMCLELKKYLGVSFDHKNVKESDMSLVTFSENIINCINERISNIAGKLKDKDTLKKLFYGVVLLQNEYMLSGVNEVIDRCFVTRNIAGISGVSIGQDDAIALLECGATERKLTIESYKYVLQQLLGTPLSFEEYKALEKGRTEQFDLRYEIIPNNDPNNPVYEARESNYEENNLSIIDKLKAIKKEKNIQSEEEERILATSKKQIENSKNDDQEPIDLQKQNIKVRAKTLIDKMIEKTHIVFLKLSEKNPSEKESEIKPIDTKRKILPLFGSQKKSS